jgi:RNA polymerase sigma-70 factor (ECF subfamily)
MADNKDYAELVEKAQLGDQNSRDRLAEMARTRLCGYVHRLTLQEDLTQDIVQETVWEMFNVFNKLKKTDQFWNWLYGIAFNKVRSHYGRQWRQKTVPLSDKQYKLAVANRPDGLAEMVAAEWKEIVIRSMQELEPRHRAVLTMRCYDRMPYSQIAKVMGCSELGVRALFYRAKKALAKKLSRYGLGKGALLAALVLFGKLTATSKEAAAGVCVPAATVKIGVPAALIAVAASRTAVVCLATAGVLGVATLMATSGPENTTAATSQDPPANPAPAFTGKTAGEYWYFFPEGTKGPLMTRFMSGSSIASQSYCQWMQDAKANYYFDSRRHTVFINNSRQYNSDLSVWRLPTDPPELTQLLCRVEGRPATLEYVSADGPGLMAVVQQGNSGGSLWTTRHFHVLKEEYFRSGWPAEAKVVDNRDAMHKRGWTYFKISGHMGDEMVLGSGRIPFVYDAARQNYPWLRLEAGNRLRIVDNGSKAVLYDAGGATTAYEGGAFFKGLPRTWMGLHTVDIVRRDAAEKGVWFETDLERPEEKAKVMLSCKQGRLDYTIDMRTDVVDRIVILTSDGKEGRLVFSYVQDIDGAGDEFVEPQITTYSRTKRQERPGILWLLKLSDSQL